MTARTRMVLVHSSDEMYGADRMLLEVVAAAEMDFDVEVWLPTDVEHPLAPLCVELRRRGVAVRHLALPIVRRAYLNPVGLLGIGRRVVTLLRALSRAKPQIVYCGTSAALLAAPLARVLGIPRVMLHAQEIWSGSDRIMLGVLARSCHQVIAISQAVVDSFPARLRDRARVVPNGTPEPQVSTTLEERSGPLTYLVASRWNSAKGYPTLLEAWDWASACGAAPGTLLVLGGPPHSGEAVDVRRIAASLTFPESVEVIGEVVDPAAFVNRADVVVVPSVRPEGFGLVAVEAFAHGRPVIASAAGGLLDIVTDGCDGWLVPPRDSRALADILVSLVRAQVTSAGASARETYLRRFTVAQFAAAWRSAVREP